jgi:hypothetical protein
LREEKISWKKILEDFKERHPKLAKEVCYWCPRDYATIQINLKNGMMLSYNYDEKRAVILCERWEEH